MEFLGKGGLFPSRMAGESKAVSVMGSRKSIMVIGGRPESPAGDVWWIDVVVAVDDMPVVVGRAIIG